jgi:membrane protease YdiL (CAAX protease family)
MQEIAGPPRRVPRAPTQPVPRGRQYSLLALLGLFVLPFALTALPLIVYPAMLEWGLWANLPGLAAAAGAAFALRPEYLAASRWRAPVPVVAAGVAAAYLLQSALVRWDPVVHRHVHVTWSLFVAAAVLTPVLEELMFRAVLLRGARYRLGTLWGVVAVDSVWAWAHPIHWLAAIQGAILCAVYLWAADSVGASVICHAAMSLVILFPQWSLFLIARR